MSNPYADVRVRRQLNVYKRVIWKWTVGICVDRVEVATDYSNWKAASEIISMRKSTSKHFFNICEMPYTSVTLVKIVYFKKLSRTEAFVQSLMLPAWTLSWDTTQKLAVFKTIHYFYEGNNLTSISVRQVSCIFAYLHICIFSKMS